MFSHKKIIPTAFHQMNIDSDNTINFTELKQFIFYIPEVEVCL